MIIKPNPLIPAGESKTGVIDIGWEKVCDEILLRLPALDTCKLGLLCAWEEGDECLPWGLEDECWTQTETDGNCYTSFNLSGFRYFKIRTNVTQTAEREFEVRVFERY